VRRIPPTVGGAIGRKWPDVAAAGILIHEEPDSKLEVCPCAVHGAERKTRRRASSAPSVGDRWFLRLQPLRPNRWGFPLRRQSLLPRRRCPPRFPRVQGIQKPSTPPNCPRHIPIGRCPPPDRCQIPRGDASGYGSWSRLDSASSCGSCWCWPTRSSRAVSPS